MTTLLLIGLIAAAAALVQAVSGFGFSLFAIPLLAVLIGPHQAVVLATVLSAALSLGAAVVYRREVRWAAVVPISVAALVGLPLGLVLLDALPARPLTILIAVLVALAAAYTGWSRSRPASIYDAPAHRPASRIPGRAVLAAGVTSGALLTSTGMNGPPLVVLFQHWRLTPAQSRASLQAAFVIQDVFAVIGFVLIGRLDGALVGQAASVLPVLLIGWAAGAVIFNRLTARSFTGVTVWLLIATAAFAVIKETL